MQKLQNLINSIKQLQSPIYIAGHVVPDDDSIGSCLSLAYLLTNLNKDCYVLLNPSDHNALKSHDIKTLITDTISHNDYTFISLDLNENYRLDIFEEYYNNAKYTINIDHHQGNNTGADIVYTEDFASSTCEIIFKIIDAISPELLSDKALCKSLYTGILTDTKCFSKRLSPDTLVFVQRLLSSGIDYESIIKNTIHHRTMYQFKALAKLVNDLQFDSFHYAIIDTSLPEYCKLTHNDIVKILAEEIRKIENIDLLLILIKKPNCITAKVASNITKNAHIIAKHFGGGGHKGEAGFTTTLSTEEILNQTKELIKTI